MIVSSSWWIGLLLTAGFLFPATDPADAEPTIIDTICGYIDHSAQAERLPPAFLTRLIWSESSFRATAISPTGARGIAQFMPGTATERGLLDPFDPEQSIAKSAELLSDLLKQFGNLGLAAAAYNAGPTRVAAWLAKQGDLPFETRAYVLRVTGHDANDWVDGKTTIGNVSNETDQTSSCSNTLQSIRIAGDRPKTEIFAPWGAQLAASFSRAAALAAFKRNAIKFTPMVGDAQPMIIGTRLLSRGYAPFFRIRIPEPTRTAAEHTCKLITSAGGACIALRS